MAPQESQEVIKEFGRPEYEKLIADNPHETAAAARQAGLGVQHAGTSRSAAQKKK